LIVWNPNSAAEGDSKTAIDDDLILAQLHTERIVRGCCQALQLKSRGGKLWIEKSRKMKGRGES